MSVGVQSLSLGVPAPMGFAARFQALLECVLEPGLDEAKAAVLEFHTADIEPAFRASSRAEFWQFRDAVLRDPGPTLARIERLVLASSRLEIGRWSATQELRRVEFARPKFLSATAYQYLAEGHEALALIQAALPPLESRPARDISEAGARLGREAVLNILYVVWAGQIMRGSRPSSDEVTESIAKGFANAMLTLASLLTASE